MVDFSYQNQSEHMVVLRCIGAQAFYLERVLFPFESLTFLAPEGSRVEIWGNNFYGPKVEERFRVSSKYEEDLLVA